MWQSTTMTRTTFLLLATLAGLTSSQFTMNTLAQWMRVAARAGDCAYIKRALDYGVPVDSEDVNKFTSLMWAAFYGRSECVDLLISYGANVDHQNTQGDTSLMWASLGGYYDVVVSLIEAGADTNIQEFDGWTALMGAIVERQYVVAEYLLKHGADKTIVNKYGHAALTLASALDNTQEIYLLGDFNHVNHQDNKSMTPLHHTIANNLTISLEAVLEFCPNHTLRDPDNKTAMEVAEGLGLHRGIILLDDYINAMCIHFGQSYGVGDIIYQGCETMVCHCTGRWRLLFGVKNPDCNKKKSIILTRQRSKSICDE